MLVVFDVIVEALLSLDWVLIEESSALALDSSSQGIDIVCGVGLVLHPVDSEALVLVSEVQLGSVALVSSVRVSGSEMN